MAYRRKQGAPRATTYEDFRPPSAAAEPESSPSSLAAQAIRASAAHRDSSLSSAYGESAYRHRTSPNPQEGTAYEYTSMKNLNESKYGFWGVLARKAKSILEDDNEVSQAGTYNSNRPHMLDKSTDSQYHQPYRSPESYRKTENPTLRKSSEAITSSLNVIGGTIRNAFEEGLKNVENKTADIIQETRKLQIRRKGSGSSSQNETTDPIQSQTDHETQLKASRDVANAMAAKAKLLLRELKTIKADLAFAKERCRQLEDENKILRESRDKGDDAEDDDLLETLLAEKARLAHENSIYARENRFLREIVEYHQLTMQDVVYVDEGIEEVSEVYPFPMPPPSSYFKSEAPSAAASPSPSPSPSPRPSGTSIGTPLSSIVVPEVCPIVPTPPTPPQIITGFVPADTKNIPAPSQVEGLKHQDSATDSA